MPYVKQEDRIRLKPLTDAIAGTEIKSEGELNYLITMLCKRYGGCPAPSYKVVNAVVGVLECAKLEYYRRLAVPYEDGKIAENGDVYRP